MIASFFQFLWRNIGTLILAFLLAIVVWVSAVITADPNETKQTNPIPIEITGLDPKLLIVGDVPENAILTIKAPRSIWAQLEKNPDLIDTWIDLSGLQAGKHTVDINYKVSIKPIKIIELTPAQTQITLERLITKNFPVELSISGSPPLGYKEGTPTIQPEEVTISGPESAMQKIEKVEVSLDISGATTSVIKNLPVSITDKNGNDVPNLSVTPKEVRITQPIRLQGGFRNVVVKVITTGQVANGYRLTNISVSPPTVTLFSDDPRLVDQLPGYVETTPVDLTNLTDDTEINVGLNLPEGVTLVSEPGVLVQVSVAAIEGSITLTLPVEIVGLDPDLAATISPQVIDVIIAGPLNILDNLTTENFRVILDLSNLPPGIYQRTPVVDLYPDQVRIQTILPETVEVNIEINLTPSSTNTGTITPAGTSSPTLTATPTP